MLPVRIPFRPRPPWLGGTLQTLRAMAWPWPEPLPAGHRLWLPLPDGDALAAMLHWPEHPPPRPLAVLVHGMIGSEDDPHLREAAAGLLRRGFPVLRLNLRGNRRSRGRSRSHYHLGRVEDLCDALGTLPPALTEPGLLLAGWSLGGALALRLLAEPPPGLRFIAGAAISPLLQPDQALAAIDAQPLFGRALLARYRAEVLAVPATDLPDRLRRAAARARSLREFEADVTAPRFGYPSYEVFVEANRAALALPQLRVPVLMLQAEDDPLVPASGWQEVDWEACPAVAPLLVAGGGHCGFYDGGAESLAVRALGAFFAGAADQAKGTGTPAAWEDFGTAPAFVARQAATPAS